MAGDKTPGDKTSGDKTPGDKTSGDKTPGDKTSGDKTQTEAQTKDELRIVLFGRQNPKLDILNIIKNTEEFRLDSSSKPKENQCRKFNRIINNKKVVIVDTPGQDTGGNEKKKLLDDIKWSVALAKPGPHVFLFVEMMSKGTSEKLKALKDFQETFGEQANDFTMVVFITDTKKEELDITDIRELTYPFSRRYFVFNIKGDKQQQIEELFVEIEKFRAEAPQASAHFYTPKMLWEAEEAEKKEEEKRRSEEEKEREESWRKAQDRLYVVAAHIGATVGMLIYDLLKPDSAGEEGSNTTTGSFSKLDSGTVTALGSMVAVIIFVVVYLVVKFRCDSKREKELISVAKNPIRRKRHQSPQCETTGGQEQHELETSKLQPNDVSSAEAPPPSPRDSSV